MDTIFGGGALHSGGHGKQPSEGGLILLFISWTFLQCSSD